MDTGAQNHALTVRNLILSRQEVGDNEHLNGVAGFGLAESGSAETILAERGQTDSLQEHDTVRVGIRVAVSEVDCVAIVCEIYGER